MKATLQTMLVFIHPLFRIRKKSLIALEVLKYHSEIQYKMCHGIGHVFNFKAKNVTENLAKIENIATS